MMMTSLRCTGGFLDEMGGAGLGAGPAQWDHQLAFTTISTGTPRVMMSKTAERSRDCSMIC